MSAAPPPGLVDRLRAAGCVFAEDEARLLTEAATDPHQLEAMVRDRVRGLPLEQLLGWAQFGGLRIAVDPGVFVPRARTELLVDEATALARPGGAPVVDLCCGSGAVGAVLRHRIPGLDLHAVDIDATAAACARRNLPGAHVYQGDLYAALPARLRGRIGVLVANAPYVPTGAIALLPPEARDHEPAVALDGGPDGLDVHRRIAAGAPRWLAPGGHLLVEVGAGQVAALAALLTAAGLRERRVTVDDTTVVIGTRRAR